MISDAFERFFESASLTSDAVLERARDQNERTHRVGDLVLIEIQRVQRENIELSRHFVENPFDARGMYRLFVETMSKRQGRSLEVGREIFNTLAESEASARETARGLFSMQRIASDAATETASRVVNSVAERATDGASIAQRAVETVTGGAPANATFALAEHGDSDAPGEPFAEEIRTTAAVSKTSDDDERQHVEAANDMNDRSRKPVAAAASGPGAGAGRKRETSARARSSRPRGAGGNGRHRRVRSGSDTARAET